jgi:hypothetical protein
MTFERKSMRKIYGTAGTGDGYWRIKTGDGYWRVKTGDGYWRVKTGDGYWRIKTGDGYWRVKTDQGCFPGVWFILADVSEHYICSIFKADDLEAM